MSASLPKLKISTPTEPVVPGRGFYQLEEDELYVQIGPFGGDRRFFSFLECEPVGLELDRHGRLIFITVELPRRRWPVDESFEFPSVAEPVDIRWLDFRTAVSPPRLATNKRRTALVLDFNGAGPCRTYQLCEHVLLQADANDRLATIWIDDIVDDLAGLEMAAFRKLLRS